MISAGEGGPGSNGATPGSGAGSGSGSGGSSGIGSGSAPIVCNTTTKDPGPSPLRLLSREQYVNTVRDLVGDIAELDSALGPENRASAFGLVQADIAQVELESYQKAADVIAAAVVANAATLNGIAPCASGADKRACASAFVQNFGTRAYRAPLTDAPDIARHMTLYDVGVKVSHEHGIEMMLRGMLQSARFLYRVELGTTEKVDANAVKLSGFEVAARLSYTLWDTLPDAKLAEAAKAGTLATHQGVAAELARMLAHPRGATLVRRFLESWVHLPDLASVVKDEAVHPEWQDTALRSAMRAQAQNFFDYVLGTEGGRLSALLTSSKVFANKDLAGYYGVTAGDAFQAFDLPAGQAAGMLTLPAVLTLTAKPDQSSPIYRGKFVREALLCQELPAPPPNIPNPPEVEPGVSTRERLNQHEVDEACRKCHELIDPLGFGFEHYDAVGRYRTTDGDQPVDARGRIVRTRDINGEFVGVAELGQKLANSTEVQECVARQWFRFALSRFEEQTDGCSMKLLYDAFRAAGADLNALPRAVVETDAFLYRRPIEVSP